MRVSVILENKAILPPGAPSFWDLPYLNLVVSGNTSLTPKALLKTLKEIERRLGRDLSAPKWSPRIIDLDILAWDNTIFSEEDLAIPHPELLNRPFLLHLMASLDPSWSYPGSGPLHAHSLGEILHHHIPFYPQETRAFVSSPQLVGIVNITPDSFSDGGKYLHVEKALQRIQELTSQGAAVIDLGAQSTRPGSSVLSPQEEWQRIEPLLQELSQWQNKSPALPLISLDSYHPEVLYQAIQHYPIDWVNDVSGGKNKKLLEFVASTQCKLVLTHSLTLPPSKNEVLSFDMNPIQFVYAWGEKKISKLAALGIPKERILLDPGIGFGKSAFQSLELLSHIQCLKPLGCDILIGHSRKSCLTTPHAAHERDLETLGVSHFLLDQPVDYLRVHNVEAHQRSLSTAALLRGLHAV